MMIDLEDGRNSGKLREEEQDMRWIIIETASRCQEEEESTNNEKNAM